MPDPADATASLANRARAYLPHQLLAVPSSERSDPERDGPALRHPTQGQRTRAASPRRRAISASARTRASSHPESAENSIIVNGMNRRDIHRMPPLGSSIVDGEGVALLTQWINALSGC